MKTHFLNVDVLYKTAMPHLTTLTILFPQIQLTKNLRKNLSMLKTTLPGEE